MMRKKTKEELSDLQDDIKRLQERVTQLECPHENRVFRTFKENTLYIYYNCPIEYCKDCGKVITKFKNLEECKRAELAYRKKQVTDLEYELQ